jgi:hypothetical protein
MLQQLIVPSASSGFDFANSNYNYDNTNTNVSSHLCNEINSINPAGMAKNHGNNERALVPDQGKMIFLKQRQ